MKDEKDPVKLTERERVWEMHSKGRRTISEIARMTGLSEDDVRRHMIAKWRGM